MNRQTWTTKEDVLKDLQMASGQQVIDVDDGFFVFGERPPPPHVCGIDDDEIELQFGQASTGLRSYEEFNSGPDLKGITEMIRNVQDTETSSLEETIRPGSANKSLIISKLNPNVKDFIPKDFDIVPCQNESESKKITVENNGISAQIRSSTNKKLNQTENSNSHNAKDLKGDPIVTKTGNSMEKTKSVQEMAAILKTKINKSNEETYEEKREKSSAIFNLLKLYSAPKAAVTAKPIKLYTPEFFETCKASEFLGNADINQNNTDSSFERKTSIHSVNEVKINEKYMDNQQNVIVKPKSETFDKITNSIKHNIKNDNVFCNKNDDSVEETSLTPSMADASIGDHNVKAPEFVVPVDPDTAESISKVNDWFEYENRKKKIEKEKPRTPVAYFGAITYKRKDPVTCKSPCDVADKKISKASQDAYEPSSYAEELLKKYQARNEKAPPLNIWEKLEQDLKKKDAEVINRKNKA